MNLLISIVSVLTLFADQDSVTLSWRANSEVDLAGYKVYDGAMSRSSRSYDSVIDNGLDTLIIFAKPLQDRYYAVTAYDTADNESDYSVEVVWKVLQDTTFFHGSELIQMNQTGFGTRGDTLIFWGIGENDTIRAKIPVTLSLDNYEIKITAARYSMKGSGVQNPELGLSFNDWRNPFTVFEINSDSMREYVTSSAGNGDLLIAFHNDIWIADSLDVNVAVESILFGSFGALQDRKPFWPRDITLNSIGANDTLIIDVGDSILVECGIPLFTDPDSIDINREEVAFNFWFRKVGTQPWLSVFDQNVLISYWQLIQSAEMTVDVDSVYEFTVTSFIELESVTPASIYFKVKSPESPQTKIIEPVSIPIVPKIE